MRLATVLCRIPVIKFRKGGSGKPSSSPAPGSCPALKSKAATASASQPAAAMSTGSAIPDIDLPARYRRQPLSQEEIDHINGGGIKDPSQLSPKVPPPPKALGVIHIPHGVLIETGKSKEVVSLNITLAREERKI